MDDDDFNLGFTPSFGTSRASRPKRVRNTSKAPTSSGGSSALDELDRMMGILPASDRPKTANNSANEDGNNFNVDNQTIHSNTSSTFSPKVLEAPLTARSSTPHTPRVPKQSPNNPIRTTRSPQGGGGGGEKDKAFNFSFDDEDDFHDTTTSPTVKNTSNRGGYNQDDNMYMYNTDSTANILMSPPNTSSFTTRSRQPSLNTSTTTTTATNTTNNNNRNNNVNTSESNTISNKVSFGTIDNDDDFGDINYKTNTNNTKKISSKHSNIAINTNTLDIDFDDDTALFSPLDSTKNITKSNTSKQTFDYAFSPMDDDDNINERNNNNNISNNNYNQYNRNTVNSNNNNNNNVNEEFMTTSSVKKSTFDHNKQSSGNIITSNKQDTSKPSKIHTLQNPTSPSSTIAPTRRGSTSSSYEDQLDSLFTSYDQPPPILPTNSTTTTTNNNNNNINTVSRQPSESTNISMNTTMTATTNIIKGTNIKAMNVTDNSLNYPPNNPIFLPTASTVPHSYNDIHTTTTTNNNNNNSSYSNPNMDTTYQHQGMSQTIIQNLQTTLEITQLKLESNEKSYQNEIETWKAKYAVSQQENAMLQGQIKQLQELNMKSLNSDDRLKVKDQEIFALNQDILHYKEKLSLLDIEYNKLKEDNIMMSVKHIETLKYHQDRADTEQKDMEHKHKTEIEMIEVRHQEMIQALKKVHLDEIESIKERTKQGVFLEQMSHQIKHTSGSIKLIEEQLNARYKGVEAVGQGHMEARERLIAEMEERAKERAESAEAETHRLKGMLTHMESVINQLKSSSQEEKDRLRLEHHRLQSLQTSLENEREAIKKMMTEEMNTLRDKQKELQNDKLQWFKDKQMQTQELQILRDRLQSEKNALENDILHHQHTIELNTMKIKEDEIVLNKLKNEILHETKVFEQKKFLNQKEMQEFEVMKASLNNQQEQLYKEKLSLETAAMELQQTSERLYTSMETMEEREQEFNKKITEYHENAMTLNSREDLLKSQENDIKYLLKELEEKILTIENENEVILHKKIELASVHREVMSYKAEHTQYILNNHVRNSWSGPLPVPPSSSTSTSMMTSARGGITSYSSSNNTSYIGGKQSKLAMSVNSLRASHSDKGSHIIGRSTSYENLRTSHKDKSEILGNKARNILQYSSRSQKSENDGTNMQSAEVQGPETDNDTVLSTHTSAHTSQGYNAYNDLVPPTPVLQDGNMTMMQSPKYLNIPPTQQVSHMITGMKNMNSSGMYNLSNTNTSMTSLQQQQQQQQQQQYPPQMVPHRDLLSGNKYLNKPMHLYASYPLPASSPYQYNNQSQQIHGQQGSNLGSRSSNSSEWIQQLEQKLYQSSGILL